jgi:hypothetical protein
MGGGAGAGGEGGCEVQMKHEIIECPFCERKILPTMFFCKKNGEDSVDCPACHSLIPMAEDGKEMHPLYREAKRLYRLGKRDPDWVYRIACKIAGKFAAAIGQTDREKIQALTIEIARKIGVRPRKNAETQEKT